MKRFRAYLDEVQGGGEVLTPLVAANPMAREHMLAYVDALEALDADRILREACAEAEKRLARSPVEAKVSLVPVDDVRGAWSERTLVDFDHRFAPRKMRAKYGYVTALVFASETPKAALLRERVLAALYRAAWTERHGDAASVADMMRQEGNALRFAGAQGPRLADPDAARAALAPHLGASLHATRFAAMFGDAAARRVGHKPLGLSDDAGFALGLDDAMRAREKPEDLV